MILDEIRWDVVPKNRRRDVKIRTTPRHTSNTKLICMSCCWHACHPAWLSVLSRITMRVTLRGYACHGRGPKHGGSEQPRIGTSLLVYSLLRTFVRSDRSLIRYIHTARFAHALRCPHSFTRTAHSLTLQWESEWFDALTRTRFVPRRIRSEQAHCLRDSLRWRERIWRTDGLPLESSSQDLENRGELLSNDWKKIRKENRIERTVGVEQKQLRWRINFLWLSIVQIVWYLKFITKFVWFTPQMKMVTIATTKFFNAS